MERNGMTGTPKKYRLSKHSICKWLLMIVLYCCLSNGIDTQTSAHTLLNAHAHRFYLMFAVIYSICLAMSTHMSPFHGWSKQQGPFVSRFISLDSWSVSITSESSKMKFAWIDAKAKLILLSRSCYNSLLFALAIFSATLCSNFIAPLEHNSKL